MIWYEIRWWGLQTTGPDETADFVTGERWYFAHAHALRWMEMVKKMTWVEGVEMEERTCTRLHRWEK